MADLRGLKNKFNVFEGFNLLDLPRPGSESLCRVGLRIVSEFWQNRGARLGSAHFMWNVATHHRRTEGRGSA